MSRPRLDLKVEITGIELKNPVILGSGDLGSTGRSLRRFVVSGFGAVVGKTVTPKPLRGNPHPRIVDVSECYLISASGLPNPGYKAFRREIKAAKVSNAPIIASITGGSPEEFVELASEMEKAGADAIELNMICPHTELPYGIHWARSPERAVEVIRAIKREIDAPVWVKIPSTGIDHLRLAQAAEGAGADALIPFPLIAAMPIDADTGRPRLGVAGGVGSITGPAIKYAGIKCVADLARAVRIPIIGTGGVMRGLDLVEYLMVGAKAVEVYTVAHRKGPRVIKHIIEEVERFMTERGYASLSEIVGLTLKYLPLRPSR